jgi:hypothetical protein
MSDSTIEMIAMAAVTGVVIGILSLVFSVIRGLKRKAESFIKNKTQPNESEDK